MTPRPGGFHSRRKSRRGSRQASPFPRPLGRPHCSPSCLPSPCEGGARGGGSGRAATASSQASGGPAPCRSGSAEGGPARRVTGPRPAAAPGGPLSRPGAPSRPHRPIPAPIWPLPTCPLLRPPRLGGVLPLFPHLLRPRHPRESSHRVWDLLLLSWPVSRPRDRVLFPAGSGSDSASLSPRKAQGAWGWAARTKYHGPTDAAAEPTDLHLPRQGWEARPGCPQTGAQAWKAAVLAVSPAEGEFP
eukprot:XP_022272221.1 uncharacterized protein LOC111094994 [Canis lupus familiaris]